MNKKLSNMYNDWATLFGRLLIGGLFAFAGFSKITNFEGTASWMSSMGLPITSFLLVLVIILEIGGGIAFILGHRIKTLAFLFAGFVILASVIFHNPMNPDQILYFTKNMMILGGLLAFSVLGGGRLTLDKILSNK